MVQLPQLVTLLLKFASQPFGAMPSQFPNPAVHVGTQTPVVHVVEPFGLMHEVAQLPQ